MQVVSEKSALILLALAAAALGGCEGGRNRGDGDAGASLGDGGTDAVPGTVVVRVTALEDGRLLSNATVRIRGDAQVGTSDADGIVTFSAVAGRRNVLLTATRDGYAETMAPVFVEPERTVVAELRLLAIQARAELDAASGGVVRSSHGAQASFPAGSLVLPDGTPATGKVVATVAALDPTRPNGLDAFPGSFSARALDGSDVFLETFVPMEVRLEQGGKRLNLATGAKAELSLPVPSSFSAVPETIPFWSLDETTGIWREEAQARRVADPSAPSGYVYRAEIGHLSWWNADLPWGGGSASSCVRGCYKSSDGRGVRGATVVAVGVDYTSATRAETDSDGCFQIAVRERSIVRVGLSGFAGTTGGAVVLNVPAAGSSCVDLGQLRADPANRPPELVRLRVVPGLINLPEGESYQLRVVGEWSDGVPRPVEGVVWSTDRTDLVTVDQAGEVTAIWLNGLARVTAAVGEIRGSALVALVGTLVSARLVITAANEPRARLPVGTTGKMVAKLVLGDGTTIDVTGDVIWQADDPRVAAVDEKGVVSGFGAGSTRITGALGGLYGVIPVEVTAAATDGGSSDAVDADGGQIDAGGGTPDGGAQWSGRTWDGTSQKDGRICQAAGCWHNPTATTSDLHDAWIASDTDAWAVGQGGVALHWNGASWDMRPTYAAYDLKGVWGSGPNDVWAVGGTGTVLRWDGARWQIDASLFTTTNLEAVWGSSATDVWACGGNAYFHFDGTSWTEKAGPGSSCRRLSGSGPNDVWSVLDSAGQLGRFDGTSWKLVDTGSGKALKDVVARAPNDVWAVGLALLHWNGTIWESPAPNPLLPSELWTSPTTGEDFSFWDLSGVAVRSGELCILGSAGIGPMTACRSSTGVWTGSLLPPNDPAAALFPTRMRGTSTGQLWGVGKQGRVWRRNGTESWARQGASPLGDQAIEAVWASSPSDAWAVTIVTGGCQVLHWDGLAWASHSKVACIPGMALSGTATDDVWLTSGTNILHWNGANWSNLWDQLKTEMSFPSAVTFPSGDVWANSRTSVFVASSSEHLYHFDGSHWSHVPNPAAAALPARSIWSSGPNDLWLYLYVAATGVPTKNYLAHWNGQVWSMHELVGEPTELPGGGELWGSGPNDIWVARGYALYHWNGSSMERFGDVKARHVWGSAASDVWASDGTWLRRYDGRAWSPELGKASSINAGWTVGGKGWVVGTKGMLLELWP